MNLENSKISKPHFLILKLTHKLDLRVDENVIALSNLSIYCTWKHTAPTWNDKFELPDGSYSVLDIQDYFEYIFKKHGEKIDKTSVLIYVTKN